MRITIEPDAPAPLFAQLIEQIKEGVANGKLQPGDALPSIRQLATDLELNNKTVAKAYQLLERDGVTQTRGYRGTVIHPNARANCQQDLQAVIAEQLNRTLASLRALGATDSELRIAFSNALNNLPQEP
jgi:GntR family transcriptional regulator